jgi:DNA-binding MarR family transcriptional regulator
MLNKTTQIHEYIAQNNGVTGVDIARHTNIDIKHVNYYVRSLRSKNLIYVSEWVQSARNMPTMLLASGNKLDAEKPLVKQQTFKKYEKRLKTHEPFKPRPDEAAAWMMNPTTPNNSDMSAR